MFIPVEPYFKKQFNTIRLSQTSHLLNEIQWQSCPTYFFTAAAGALWQADTKVTLWYTVHQINRVVGFQMGHWQGHRARPQQWIMPSFHVQDWLEIRPVWISGIRFDGFTSQSTSMARCNRDWSRGLVSEHEADQSATVEEHEWPMRWMPMMVCVWNLLKRGSVGSFEEVK